MEFSNTVKNHTDALDVCNNTIKKLYMQINVLEIEKQKHLEMNANERDDWNNKLLTERDGWASKLDTCVSDLEKKKRDNKIIADEVQKLREINKENLGKIKSIKEISSDAEEDKNRMNDELIKVKKEMTNLRNTFIKEVDELGSN